MKLRDANRSDKNTVLEFCKNTFSWGDYIPDVWDFWIDEGGLFVIEKDCPLGMCHAFFSNHQVWIEGIRVSPYTRRKGLASKLISHVESLALKKDIHLSLMLIDTENYSSLCMAKNLDYEAVETWKFYSLIPKQNKDYGVKFGITKKNLLSHYVKSWRWLPLDDNTIESLNSNCKIICSGEKNNTSFAILTDSEHFEKILIVTMYVDSENTPNDLVSYIQNYGFNKGYHRIQILTKEFLPNFSGMEYRISFNLMKKLLH